MKKIKFLFLFLWVPFWLSAQITVTGTVKDKNGEALIGVSVVEKGTSKGTATDLDGNYSLSNVANNATLVFSYIGYATQSVPVQGRNRMDAVMSEDTKLLDEVVVVGYGTMRRSDVTGAIASMNSDVLKEVPSANITQALQGRMAGINISQTSTRPGQTGQIRIRGMRSLSANNDPLIVVDGIPFAGTLGDLNPGDIQSIDVLKDASATAIYGSRGANGVILITTMRGTTGEARITYNGFYGVKTVAEKYEVFNGEELHQLRKLTGRVNNTAEEQAMYDAGRSTDWQDLAYQNAHVTQHDVNVAGGSKKGQYSMGLGYYDENTAFYGQNYSRFSIRMAIDQEIGKYLKIGLNSQNSYSVTDGESASFMYSLITLSPLLPAYNDDGTLKEELHMAEDSRYNPLIVTDNSLWTQQRKRFNSFNSLYGEIKFTDFLKYRLNIGLTYRQDNYGHYYAGSYPSKGVGSKSDAAVQNTLTTSWTAENLLYFDKTFADKHKIGAVAMYSAQETVGNQSRMNAQDLVADYMQYYNLGYYNEGTGRIEIPASSQWYSRTSLLSYMLRVNYAYESRYLLTVTGRYDGASVLAKGHKWFAYPAISAGWNIGNEEFAKNIKGLDMLKLRTGYGQTANQAVGAYKTLGTLEQNRYNFGEEGYAFGYYVNALANSALGWESTDTWNIGLDFALLNSRLRGSVEWYTQHTKNILVEQSLPETSGVPGNIWVNKGESQNKGMEFSLSGDMFKNHSSGFEWTLDANLFFNRNKIIGLNNGTDRDESHGWFTGHPIDVIFDYKKVGIWQLEEAGEAAKYGRKPGEVKILDYNQDGKITEADRHVVDKFTPDLEGGFSSRMGYNNFDLTIVGFFRVGGTLVSQIHQGGSYLNRLDGRINQIKVDYWTPWNPTNEYPMPNTDEKPTSAGYSSTIGLYDAGFLKIRSMTLGYNVPKKFLDKFDCSSLRLYFTAQNPFVFFSDYMKRGGGVDPETTGNAGSGYIGSDSAFQDRHLIATLNTPPMRSFILGLNLSF